MRDAAVRNKSARFTTLAEENDRLRKLVDQLRTTNASLRAENASLRKKCQKKVKDLGLRP